MFIFKYLLLVTILTTNLQETRDAYQQHLLFEPTHNGVITTEQATLWQSSELAGSSYQIMRAASGKPAYIRFVEVDKPFLAQQQKRGWRAVELLSTDVELMAKKLSASPFNIIGPPAWISDKRHVKAMQMEGPNGEIIYLSQVVDIHKMLLTKVQGTTLVDRPFIMVTGGKPDKKALDFYRNTLGLKTLGPFPYRIETLAKQLSVPLDTLFDLSLAKVTPEFSLEIDSYPEQAKDNRKNPIFSITLVAQKLSVKTPTEQLTQRQRINGHLYDNRETQFITGEFGERFEIIYDDQPLTNATK